jgi:1-aminocyclopropane-1-carboxylate deaminase/D-cysteine desulfhydrase-like pyridoxal-dependent ACC family enzyme
MVRENFLAISKIPLAPLNTPVEKIERLSAAIDGAPNLFIKRDDFIGQLVWGNKLRKLEYTFARALSEGADTVITCGAVQSNHARTTAQVAKRLGLDCVLVLNGREPEIPTANYRIVRLMDVTVRLVGSREERDPEMKRIAEELKLSGKNPCIIPLGASDETGAAGFAAAVMELSEQSSKMSTFFTHIYHSTSSGGTQGGLEAGKRIFGMEEIEITGISADDSPSVISSKVMACANPLLEKIGYPGHINADDINVESGFTGPGYGIPSPESDEARQLFLSHEGILLDDTYTAKAAAGLIAHCRAGKFSRKDNVLFWHTGGIINLF